MKIVYSDPKTGNSNQVDAPQDISHYLLNKRIGDEIDGSVFGLIGYKLKITGGSDKSGFPMDKSIDNAIKTKILKRLKKDYQRKLVRGKIISNDTEQINTVIIEYGSKPLDEIFKQKPKSEPKDRPKDKTKTESEKK